MEKIVCGPDNLKDFNARLRNLSPEFYGLAKELHQSGLLQGLGGATIQTGFDVVKSDGEEVQPKSSNTCKQCGHWERDSVGDGSGIGICLAETNGLQKIYGEMR